MLMLPVKVKVVNFVYEKEGLEHPQHIYTIVQQICEVKAKKNCGTNQQENHC